MHLEVSVCGIRRNDKRKRKRARSCIRNHQLRSFVIIFLAMRSSRSREFFSNACERFLNTSRTKFAAHPRIRGHWLRSSLPAGATSRKKTCQRSSPFVVVDMTDEPKPTHLLFLSSLIDFFSLLRAHSYRLLVIFSKKIATQTNLVVI